MPTLRTFLNISNVIIAEVVIPLYVLSTYTILSLYTQIKVDSEIFHSHYGKKNNLWTWASCPTSGATRPYNGHFAPTEICLFHFVIKWKCVTVIHWQCYPDKYMYIFRYCPSTLHLLARKHSYRSVQSQLSYSRLDSRVKNACTYLMQATQRKTLL